MAARRQFAKDGPSYSEQQTSEEGRYGASGSGGRNVFRQRTSLSSLKEFVPAKLPSTDENPRTKEEDEEATVVNVQRMVLGPMDLASPNRKGARLAMKAKLGSSQLSLEWIPDLKVVVNLPFDSIGALQVCLG